METKLTLVSVYARSRLRMLFVELPVDPDGKVRIQSKVLTRELMPDVGDGDTLSFG